jgi:hypothetical protein
MPEDTRVKVLFLSKPLFYIILRFENSNIEARNPKQIQMGKKLEDYSTDCRLLLR